MAPQPPKKKSTAKRVLWISLAAVVVGAASVGIVAVVTRNGHDPAVEANADDPTIQRPGHPGDGQGNSPVADGAPLKETKTTQPVSYHGEPVIQSCNLLSLADLEKLGLYYASNPLSGSHQRGFISESGTAPVDVRTTDTFLPVVAVNRCLYGLEVGPGHNPDIIEVDVYQPNYANIKNLRIIESERYQPQAAIGDVAVYTKPSTPGSPKDIQHYLLQRGDTVVKVDGQLTPDVNASHVDQILKTVAANLDVQAAHPTGPSTITIDSPVFPKSIAQPSMLLDADMFAKVYGTAPAPIVVDQPATAVGRITFTPAGPTHNYVEDQRTLSTGENLESRRKNLTLHTTSYLTEDSAIAQIRSARETVKAQNLPTTIGDDSFIVSQGDDGQYMTGILVVRKGRFIFEVGDESLLGHMSPAQAASLLPPIGQQILQKLNDQK